MLIYLSGCQRADLPDCPGLGVMLNPRDSIRPTLLQSCRWAADNGCYAAGESFNPVAWRRWLDHLRPFQETCLFVAAPDVVADARATWERSEPHLATLRADGWPVAVVAQDGLQEMLTGWDGWLGKWDDAHFWGRFDVLFVGGSTRWKLGREAEHAVASAKARGKWVHMGRVNSARRLRYALSIGCDSVDGTYIAFAPDRNLLRVERWLRELQPTLPFWQGGCTATSYEGSTQFRAFDGSCKKIPSNDTTLKR